MGLKGQGRAEIAQEMTDDLVGIMEDAGLEGLAEYAAGDVPETFELPYTEEEQAAARAALRQAGERLLHTFGNGGMLYGRRAPRRAQQLARFEYERRQSQYDGMVLALYELLKKQALEETRTTKEAVDYIREWLPPKAIEVVERHLADLDALAEERNDYERGL